MTTDEKGVIIQIQNTIVSSKALVLVNCLNTFTHDCSFANLRPERNGLMAPFLAISSTLRAERCDLKLDLSPLLRKVDQEKIKLLLDFRLFSRI